jgi:hypothetical protein
MLLRHEATADPARDGADETCAHEIERDWPGANTMLYALYPMGSHGRATTHGFRTVASTILNESNLFNRDWIERQLAHVERNEVRRAYNAAEWMPDRRRMMQWWADHITAVSLEGDEVVQLAQAIRGNTGLEIQRLFRQTR